MRLRWCLALAATTLAPLSVHAESPETEGRGGSGKTNVVVIVLDDVGFGHLSSFGGPYRTPNIERVANEGLRYTSFHTTALCSPTRAALLTGRNHHSVGMATITETASDQPGYNGKIPKSAGTLAAILKASGYSTYALGKWHLTPQPESGIDGPFDRWPTSMGFDHWYGFQGADADQFSPGLWSDTTPVEPSHDGQYHLTTDLADKAVKYLEEQKGAEKPFFLYFATGAGHAPHQVPKEWVEKNRGRFDDGWDVMRERTFAKQKEMGLVPADAQLPARNDAIKSWVSLTKEEKQLFARMQEVHAGFIEHTDHEIGRLLDALEKSGKKDDTLVMLISDNGASGEGGPFGSINEFRTALVEETFDEVYDKIDELGGPKTYNHYPAGWAQAGNTPFRYWKQETHEGGVRDPMIVSWPSRIKDAGGIRSQFQHVVDVTPTVLEATGVEAPTTLDGVEQKPLAGKSMINTFASADEPTARKVQYFEMLGNRAIWADGWKAVAFHGRLPWLQGVISLRPFDDDRWELYDLTKDPTETTDLASTYPDKLRELQAVFDQQAKDYDVFPLDDTGLVARAAALQSSLTARVSSVTYDQPKIRVSESLAPWLKGRAHTITADLDIPQGGADGTIVAHGGRFGGYALYVKDGMLTYSHNFVGKDVYTIASTKTMPEGPVTVRFKFELSPIGNAAGTGIGQLFINDEKVAEGKIDNTVTGPYGFADTFDIGSDTVTPVAPDAYESPFPFKGTVLKLKFDMDTAY